MINSRGGRSHSTPFTQRRDDSMEFLSRSVGNLTQAGLTGGGRATDPGGYQTSGEVAIFNSDRGLTGYSNFAWIDWQGIPPLSAYPNWSTPACVMNGNLYMSMFDTSATGNTLYSQQQSCPNIILTDFDSSLFLTVNKAKSTYMSVEGIYPQSCFITTTSSILSLSRAVANIGVNNDIYTDTSLMVLRDICWDQAYIDQSVIFGKRVVGAYDDVSPYEAHYAQSVIGGYSVSALTANQSVIFGNNLNVVRADDSTILATDSIISGSSIVALGSSISSTSADNVFIWSSSAVSGSSITSHTFNIQANNGVRGYGSTRFYVDPSITSHTASNELVTRGWVLANSGSGGATVTGAVSGVAVWATSSSLTSYASFNYVRPIDTLIAPSTVRNLSTIASASSVAIGTNNTASGNQSFVGGNSSFATGNQSMAFGLSATASGEGSIALGYATNARGQGSVAMGYNSSATGQGSIALGYRALAPRQGQVSIASGGISGTQGRGQFFIITKAQSTYSTSPAVLDDSSLGYTVLLENSKNYVLWISVAGRQTNGNNEAAVFFRSAIRRRANASQTVLYSNNRFADLLPAGWDVTLAADTTNGALNILVNGGSAQDVDWCATIQVTEV